MTPYLLAVLAVLLAGPVPALMARMTWLRRTPFAAILLWQAVAAAAVLAAVGAGLATVTRWTHGDDHGPAAFVVALLALTLTGVVVGRLLLSGHLVGVKLRAQRRRQRETLDLVSTRSDSGRVLVVEHDVPVAYCLPSMAQPRVVLSAAAVQTLAPGELNAVFAHERAHLNARHDLVLEAFTVLHRAFPHWVSSDAALREVKLLVEVLADRAALKVGSPAELGRALLAMAQGRAPEGAMGAAHAAAHGDLVVRVRLLADLRPRRVQAAALLGAAWAVVVVPTALVVAPWLISL
ncbi:M56 family metallopeptidase [Nocardioides yefusunii]|uniref:M56 family metallopeptidase n=1 Tax=Nocardioides yefusunii TaxID=2500546 RepID=A0ABW1QSI8_9ACTN|nr:M56 family metallopeptidase [Nocardioides yefusunii]